MSYIPSSILPEFQKACIEIRDELHKNYGIIIEAVAAKAVKQSGVTPKIKVETLVKFCEGFVIPQIQRLDGGWVDHPKDEGGPTMRGIISVTFQAEYNKIFIEWPRLAGLNSLADKAEALALKYEGVRGGNSNNSEVKAALFAFNSSNRVSAMFIWSILCSPGAGFPIAVMSADAWLGFIQFDMCWAGGITAVFSTASTKDRKAEFDVVAQKFGYTGTPGQQWAWAKWINDTLPPPNLPKFAVACFASQVSYYDRALPVSGVEVENLVFRGYHFDRLINNKVSTLKMCIIINEIFNKNTKTLFTFDEKEKEYLSVKAATYETLSINYPTGG